MATQKQTNSGNIDYSFGNNDGKAPLIFPEAAFQVVSSVTVTPQAKILAIGSFQNQFIVGCLSENGVVDLSFGRNGTIIGRFKNHASAGGFVHALKDGKVLVTGTVSTDNRLLPAATRLLANGEVDTTFGEDGTFIFPAKSKAADKPATASRLVNQSRSTEGSGAQSSVLADGKIIITFPYFSDFHGLLIRLTADGHLDTSFNGIGYTSVRSPLPDTAITYISSFLVTSTGAIVICGHANTWPEGRNVLIGLMARYSSDGRLDSSFGNDGFFALESPDSTMVDSAVENRDGNFVGVGVMTGGSLKSEAAMAFGVTADGRVDATFNNGKINRLNLVRSEWYSAALMPLSNSTIATGINYDVDNNMLGVIVSRYLHTGKLDIDFGNGKGWALLEPGTEARVALQADKILISYTGREIPRVCEVVRLLP